MFHFSCSFTNEYNNYTVIKQGFEGFVQIHGYCNLHSISLTLATPTIKFVEKDWFEISSMIALNEIKLFQF